MRVSDPDRGSASDSNPDDPEYTFDGLSDHDPDDPAYVVDQSSDSDDPDFINDSTNPVETTVPNEEPNQNIGTKPLITSVYHIDSINPIKEEVSDEQPNGGFCHNSINPFKVEVSELPSLNAGFSLSSTIKVEEPNEELNLDSINLFEVKVPLIGKPAFPVTTEKPFTHCYDLAIEGNQLKALEEQKEKEKYLTIDECKKLHKAGTLGEVEPSKCREKISALQKASHLTKIGVRILRELTKEDEFDEDIVVDSFSEFLNIPATYLALIYSPHLVHTIMFARGNKAFPSRVRKCASECYWKCHALFPIPAGSNFQTVYASEVKKQGLKELNGLEICNLRREYGDSEDDLSDNGNSVYCENRNES